jgi:hypothetical protein
MNEFDDIKLGSEYYFSKGTYSKSELILSFACLKKHINRNCFSCPKYFKKDCREFWAKYGYQFPRSKS